MTNTPGSITRLIREFRNGDPDAFERLWNRYTANLRQINGRQLSNLGPTVDADDVVQETWMAASRRLEDPDGISNRDDLWRFLVAECKRRRVDLFRRETALKRGGGRVVSEGALTGPNGEGTLTLAEIIVDPHQRSELKSSIREQFEALQQGVPEEEWAVAVAVYVDGLTIQQTADQLGVSKRTVDRRLQRVRNAWAKLVP